MLGDPNNTLEREERDPRLVRKDLRPLLRADAKGYLTG